MNVFARLIAIAVSVPLFLLPARSSMTTNSWDKTVADASHDFDFLFGRWKVHNRRLHNPLTGSREWYEFEATSDEEPLLGGHANLEQYDAAATPHGPIHAVAMRLYDAKSHNWAIYWSTADSGVFGIPTIGSFKDGVGTFFDREKYNGRMILVKFIWSHSRESSCRWEQSFSPDDGKTWEVNWTMDFTRV